MWISSFNLQFLSHLYRVYTAYTRCGTHKLFLILSILCSIKLLLQHSKMFQIYHHCYLSSLNPISHGVKEDPPSYGGAIITTGLTKYFPTDSWLFLYIYQLCYVSGHPMQKELSLASKLCIWGPFKNRTQKLKKVRIKIFI